MRTVLAAIAAVVLLAQPAFAQPGLGADFVQTQFGPLGPAGKDMLVKVRLAGLWEGPAGRMGLEKSASPQVQEAGRHLIDGHKELDAKTLELGRTFNLQLPTQPNADQQGWLGEMTAAPARSAEFDKIFPNRLRAAHGGVYKFLAAVRTGTRNTAIRDFAKRCMEVVLDHMTVLEATGMVDFNDTEAIPLAAIAAPAPASSAPVISTARQQIPQPIAQNNVRDDSGGSDVLLGLGVLAVMIGGIYFWTGGKGSGKRRA